MQITINTRKSALRICPRIYVTAYVRGYAQLNYVRELPGASAYTLSFRNAHTSMRTGRWYAHNKSRGSLAFLPFRALTGGSGHSAAVNIIFPLAADCSRGSPYVIRFPCILYWNLKFIERFCNVLQAIKDKYRFFVSKLIGTRYITANGSPPESFMIIRRESEVFICRIYCFEYFWIQWSNLDIG